MNRKAISVIAISVALLQLVFSFVLLSLNAVVISAGASSTAMLLVVLAFVQVIIGVAALLGSSQNPKD